MTLILASKSPRRRELLSRLTSEFEVIPSHAEESSIGSPLDQVLDSARAKAHAVARQHEGLILGADTLVVLEDCVMGKPRSRSDAEAMLRALAGRTHRVLSGMCLVETSTGVERLECVETHVAMRALTERDIEWYLDSGEYEDKAGGYAIQGKAAVFIERIVGEYTNVMGLPLCELGRLLREFNVRF